MPHVPALRPLYNLGTKLRRGQLAMLVGRPGSQKSGFAMWLVKSWGLPTLYVSGDMSQYTAAMRVTSMHTGLTNDEIEARVNTGDDAFISEALAESNIQFVFNSEPTLDDIDHEIDAWVERFDSYPSVLVVDNLLDMAPLSESSFQSNRNLLLEFKDLCRRTNAFVLVVHHNKEEGDPNYPAPSRAIQDKVSQTPEVAISIALDQSGDRPRFRGATVKNRGGPASQDATRWFELSADPSRTWFGSNEGYH
jgi:KaiC/GvpD/RAD55 family RecA-like ATPase